MKRGNPMTTIKETVETTGRISTPKVIGIKPSEAVGATFNSSACLNDTESDKQEQKTDVQ